MSDIQLLKQIAEYDKPWCYQYQKRLDTLAEDMEKYGIFEVLEEDLAVCEYVCPSKINIQAIISDGIELMLKEMA